MKLSTFLTAAIAFGFITMIVISAIPAKTTPENCAQVNGTVLKVMAGGMNDITVSLSDASGLYFVRKGMEKGLNSDSLSRLLVGKRVTIYYPEPTIFENLVPQQSPRNIMELRVGENVIFSEFNKSQ